MSPSRRRTPTPRDRRRQRGSVLAMTGIAMIMIVAMAVVGVDVGHLAFTANEVQTLADLSATSYVKTLALNLDDGGSRNPEAETGRVIEQNSVGGATATIAANIESFEPGNYDNVARQFTPGGMPVNAVRANAVATVPNFFAGIFGSTQTAVRRNATAALVPPARAPVLPLAIGSCHWDIFQNTGDCSEQPQFTLVPNPDENACWTSLGSSSANTNDIAAIIRTYCGLSTGSATTVGVGDSVNLVNGKLTPLLRAVQDCVSSGFHDFVIPVIPCRAGNDCTQSDPVTEFATIHIGSPSDVVVTGTAASTGVYADSICSTDPPGAAGAGTGEGTGTEIVGLVF
jgi:hypothetical protein